MAATNRGGGSLDDSGTVTTRRSDDGDATAVVKPDAPATLLSLLFLPSFLLRVSLTHFPFCFVLSLFWWLGVCVCLE